MWLEKNKDKPVTLNPWTQISSGPLILPGHHMTLSWATPTPTVSERPANDGPTGACTACSCFHSPMGKLSTTGTGGPAKTTVTGPYRKFADPSPRQLSHFSSNPSFPILSHLTFLPTSLRNLKQSEVTLISSHCHMY